MGLHDLLSTFRTEPRSHREMGARFEHLMKAYLQHEPNYAERFSDVWVWEEWPDRPGVDTGIDLVAKERATGELCAIQCKFYNPEHTLQKSDIDSFFTASGKSIFNSRLIVSTTDRWSKHAEDALHGQSIPVTRLRVQELVNSAIDWSKFDLKKPEQVVCKPKKQLRQHQQEALSAVMEQFQTHPRGKLIMACGTGKTFTALKIAEQFQSGDKHSGLILFLVPSISLLNQTLHEWTQNAECHLVPFAVCSDTKVGRKKVDDVADLTVTDLPINATTDPQRLITGVQQFKSKELTVIFSTYQSIDVLAQAQVAGLPEFDLIICDEAHRTTGVTLAGQDESTFVRVHDQQYLQSKKRLYMTATPRIYDEGSKKQAEEGGAVLASMDDEKVFGPEFYHLGFGSAVEKQLLTDYKVLVLAVNEKYVDKTFQQQLAQDGELQLDDMVKITGCWNGLSKRIVQELKGTKGSTLAEDPQPMRRAVAFAKDIKSSKHLSEQFENVVDANIRQLSDQTDKKQQQAEYLHCEVRHVDGTMNALERGQHLDWLREDPASEEDQTCRILSNARCLSEGVDVPGLDAVMFLTPRGSVVDVVQSVGRVMRRAEGKKYGYIILPIGIPAGVSPEEALRDNKKYKTVWQVLQALRAHDDRFHATINKIELNQSRPHNINLIGVGTGEEGDELGSGDSKLNEQPQLDFEWGKWQEAIYAKMVKRVGDRRYWQDWAKDVSEIANRQIQRIQTILEQEQGAKEAFDEFLGGLHENINDSISVDDAVEMLAQHMITQPVFEALFDDYNFTAQNPVSQAMQRILQELHNNALAKEQESLEKFYDSVRRRAEGIDNAEGRQKVVIELYDTFFRNAFPRMAERLGIVYTPVEVVDFIIQSVEVLLKERFGASLSDQGVQVLDPFTGTGTFITRLLQSGLIKKKDLLHKYQKELHANEIVLLAYYIAAVNIEAAFYDLSGKTKYHPFEGIVLTDTFNDKSGVEILGFQELEENNQRIRRQQAQDIRVIISNPPYSAGQKSQNDNNQNLKYPTLDARIESTYVARSTGTNKNSLYDSYIRGIRWASDRIKDKGIIGYVTNGSFIDGNAAEGLRKSLYDEFAYLYVFNLRGHSTGSGEQRRREKGNVFLNGTKATIAITLMVKDPEHQGECQLHYYDIGDYLSRNEKLKIIRDFRSVAQIPFEIIKPNDDGDWINHRNEVFEKFLSLEESVFEISTNGLQTNRDIWVYNFSRQTLQKNVENTIEEYNRQLDVIYPQLNLKDKASELDKRVDSLVLIDNKKIDWTRELKRILRRGRRICLEEIGFRLGLYRPFQKSYVYFNRDLNSYINQIPKIYPQSNSENLGIHVSGIGANKGFSALMSNILPNLHTIDTGQYFPLYTYDLSDTSDALLGHDTRQENIPKKTLEKFQSHYDDQKISREDIFYYVYGLLHSDEYRTQFKADLGKMLPRIPFAQGFWEFSQAGRKLGHLHVNYEDLEPYPLEIAKHGLRDDADDFRIDKMKHPGKRGQEDRSVIEYNPRITISGIPEKTHQYVVNGKSALAWVMERYQVKTDKDSGIVNDPNLWMEEQDDPEYVLRLIGQVVRVSVETVDLVQSLPKLVVE